MTKTTEKPSCSKQLVQQKETDLKRPLLERGSFRTSPTKNSRLDAYNFLNKKADSLSKISVEQIQKIPKSENKDEETEVQITEQQKKDSDDQTKQNQEFEEFMNEFFGYQSIQTPVKQLQQPSIQHSQQATQLKHPDVQLQPNVEQRNLKNEVKQQNNQKQSASNIQQPNSVLKSSLNRKTSKSQTTQTFVEGSFYLNKNQSHFLRLVLNLSFI